MTCSMTCALIASVLDLITQHCSDGPTKLCLCCIDHGARNEQHHWCVSPEVLIPDPYHMSCSPESMQVEGCSLALTAMPSSCRSELHCDNADSAQRAAHHLHANLELHRNLAGTWQLVPEMPDMHTHLTAQQ